MITIPAKSPEQFNLFIEQNKDIFYRFVLNKIGKAIDKSLVQAELFKFDSGLKASIKPDDYIGALGLALEYFIEVEDYENAAIVRDTINRVKIEHLISNTKNVG